MAAVMVLSPYWAEKVLADREALPPDSRREEVWDGVTYIMPEADNPHDKIAGFFYRVFWAVFGGDEANAIHFRINVSDRDKGWDKNYRNPDMCLYLAGTAAKDMGNHWVGGPDFALEVVSPNDYSREKLDFYAAVRTREAMIIDRDPWQLELFRLSRGAMRSRGTVRPDDGKTVKSAVAPFEFALVAGEPRPKVKIIHTETGQEWVG
jgi:Uma2 family endonuclease